MPDIDYTPKSDRDLLVEVVVTTNGISQKLDTFCEKVEILEIAQARLKQEHDLRMGDCSLPPPISRKAVAVSAGAGGGLVGLLVVIAQVILNYLSK